MTKILDAISTACVEYGFLSAEKKKDSLRLVKKVCDTIQLELLVGVDVFERPVVSVAGAVSIAGKFEGFEPDQALFFEVGPNGIFPPGWSLAEYFDAEDTSEIDLAVVKLVGLLNRLASLDVAISVLEDYYFRGKPITKDKASKGIFLSSVNRIELPPGEPHTREFVRAAGTARHLATLFIEFGDLEKAKFFAQRYVDTFPNRNVVQSYVDFIAKGDLPT